MATLPETFAAITPEMVEALSRPSRPVELRTMYEQLPPHAPDTAWLDYLIDDAHRHLGEWFRSQSPLRVAPIDRLRCRENDDTHDLIFEARFRDGQRWGWRCQKPRAFDQRLLERCGFNHICSEIADEWCYRIAGYGRREFRIAQLIAEAHRRLEHGQRYFARARAYEWHREAWLAVDPGRPGDDRTAVVVGQYNGFYFEETTAMTATQVAAQQEHEHRTRIEIERAYGGPLALQAGAFWGGALNVEAEERGQKLLREWLSPAQLKQYEDNGTFEVVGRETGTRYRIIKGRSHNVLELDRKGDQVASLCFAPEGSLAIGDVMLAQKVALETNERAALKVANRNPLNAMYHGGATGARSWLFDIMWT